MIVGWCINYFFGHGISFSLTITLFTLFRL